MRYALILCLCIFMSACVQKKHSPCFTTARSIEGEEVTYHYARINEENGDFQYAFYINVNKNGDIKFVKKQNRDFVRIKKILNYAKEKAYIEAIYYESARWRGLKFENVEATYFKKGECGYQDALEYYFRIFFGYPFLLEYDGETKNLVPILRKDLEARNPNELPDIYNEKGENVGGFYWHGEGSITLPVTSDSGGQTFSAYKRDEVIFF